MGIFSFLTGKADDDAPATPPAVAPPVTSSLATDTPAPAGPSPAAPEAEASGWDIDTGALTAPIPKPAETPTVGPADPDLTAEFQGPVIEAIKTVYDPEIPVDIYELGLIYDIAVDKDKQVLVKMTLTSPACPSAQQLPSEVRYKIKALPGVTEAVVEIVWEPPWDKDRMSEVARLQLGFM
jgi:FeS assembly SUF system protein